MLGLYAVSPLNTLLFSVFIPMLLFKHIFCSAVVLNVLCKIKGALTLPTKSCRITPEHGIA